MLLTMRQPSNEVLPPRWMRECKVTVGPWSVLASVEAAFVILYCLTALVSKASTNRTECSWQRMLRPSDSSIGHRAGQWSTLGTINVQGALGFCRCCANLNATFRCQILTWFTSRNEQWCNGRSIRFVSELEKEGKRSTAFYWGQQSLN